MLRVCVSVSPNTFSMFLPVVNAVSLHSRP